MERETDSTAVRAAIIDLSRRERVVLGRLRAAAEASGTSAGAPDVEVDLRDGAAAPA